MTSSLSTTYSEVGVLLNSGLATTPIFDQKTGSIDPDYNFGYHAKPLYRIPPTRNAISLDDTYLLNNGDGRLKRDKTTVRQGGKAQRNIQNDRGHQHFHLHIVDLIFSRRFLMYEHIAFLLGGGMTYNDFNYFFNFHDQAIVTNTDEDDNQLSTIDAQIKSQRKTNGWGLGPKVEWHFGFHFTKMDWRHDASVNVALQLATLFCKFWSWGSFSVDGTGSAGPLPINSVAIGKWEDGTKFQVVPNINLDLSFQYKYETQNNVSLSCLQPDTKPISIGKYVS